MKLTSGHLSYCTNIHAGESWADHFASLRENFPLIKEKVSSRLSMGIGLRLSNAASLDLEADANMQEFRYWLEHNDAYVFTMNGFPYGDFHHTVVKDQVHAPDWTTRGRMDYTIRLFRILAGLLPGGMDGGISTSPLSYRHWFREDELKEVTEIATRNILLVAEELFRLKTGRGVSMHLDIEPEPDGILETGREFIDWYENILVPMALRELPGRLGITAQAAENCVREHITLCYDICHFAIGYEDHENILRELADKGIKTGKVQISAALKADLPEGGVRETFAEAFAKFNESTYLHQVVARGTGNELIRYRDLPQALNDIGNPSMHEWRAHFHVPVFNEDLGLLKSTQSDIRTLLQIQRDTSFTNHMEVETYTWEVLPDSLKEPVHLSIARELNWVKNFLEQENE